jgi:hypothetical protein
VRDLPFLLIRLQLTYTFPVNRDVADLFYELVDLTPAQRETYFLEQSVAPEVRLQVESLLAFDSGDEHLLTAPVAQWAEQLAAQTRGTSTPQIRGSSGRLQAQLVQFLNGGPRLGFQLRERSWSNRGKCHTSTRLDEWS